MEKEKRFQELYDGFEGKELSEIWSHAKFEEGAVKIQSEIFRKGKSAVKIVIHKGDRIEQGNATSKTSERDELLERKEFGPMENEGFSYAFSMFIPNDFPIVPTRLVLAQWKQNEENDNALVDNPILALRYQKGELFVTLQTAEEKKRIFSTREEVRGKWLDFIFHVKFTRGKEGFVKVWMNEIQIVDYKGVTAYSEKYNYPKPGHFYFKIGLYRDRMDEPMTIYIDEFKKSPLTE
jgi:hypothetical protein